MPIDVTSPPAGLPGQRAVWPPAAVQTGNGQRRWYEQAAALVIAAWVVLSLARLLLPSIGLRAQYLDNPQFAGTPVRQQIDPEVSTLGVWRGWGYVPPDVFSVRWTGQLTVGEPGDYTFTLSSDDGSALYVDRHLVVDHLGNHAAVPKSGQVQLSAGAHAVLIEYSQDNGPYTLEWTWTRSRTTPALPSSPVPAWRLSPQPAPVALLALSYTVRQVWPWWSLFTLVALVTWLVARGTWPAHQPDIEAATRAALARRSLTFTTGSLARSRGGAAAFVLCALLATVHTWPLASDPAHLSRNDNADTVLNEWAMAWVAHELPRQPWHLFDAGIFHPERYALVFSEPLVVQGVLAAPFLALGASPVLAYSLVLLLGMTLTAWGMTLVMWRWTGDWTAGLVSGVVVAFNAHTLTRLPHIQAQHAEFLPLGLLAFDALLRTRRWSAAGWLAVAVALQAMASVYLFVFLVCALIVSLAVRPEDWTGARFRPVAWRLAVAAMAAAVVLVPLFLPYWFLRTAGFVRSLDEAAWFSASLRDYVTTPARWYAWAGGDTALFPGVVALALALVTFLSARAFRDPRARMAVAIGILGVLFSFGPAVAPGYERLYRFVPLLQAVRTASRFGYLGTVSVSLLAGFGLATVRAALARVRGSHVARPALATALTLVAMVGVSLEPLAAPLELERFDGIPAIYALPRERPDGVVVELPFPRPESIYLNASALLHATQHWRPLLNGYSGFVPPSYAARFASLQDFPADAAVAALQQAGVTHAFVHRSELSALQREQLDARTDLVRVATDGDTVLYDVRTANAPSAPGSTSARPAGSFLPPVP